jgi:hypothetical protein
MPTAAWPVSVAIVGVLEADSALGAVIGDRIYSGLAPQATQYPYVTMGDSTEGAFNHFGRVGRDGTETIHVWSRAIGKAEVLAIYGHLERLLNGTTLTVAGFRHVRGRLSLVTVFVDPDRVTMHLVARYDVLTQVAV